MTPVQRTIIPGSLHECDILVIKRAIEGIELENTAPIFVRTPCGHTNLDAELSEHPLSDCQKCKAKVINLIRAIPIHPLTLKHLEVLNGLHKRALAKEMAPFCLGDMDRRCTILRDFVLLPCGHSCNASPIKGTYRCQVLSCCKNSKVAFPNPPLKTVADYLQTVVNLSLVTPDEKQLEKNFLYLISTIDFEKMSQPHLEDKFNTIVKILRQLPVTTSIISSFKLLMVEAVAKSPVDLLKKIFLLVGALPHIKGKFYAKLLLRQGRISSLRIAELLGLAVENNLIQFYPKPFEGLSKRLINKINHDAFSLETVKQMIAAHPTIADKLDPKYQVKS